VPIQPRSHHLLEPVVMPVEQECQCARFSFAGPPHQHVIANFGFAVVHAAAYY